MTNKVLLSVVTALMLSACATPTPKVLSATGGSKADGTVQLSYEYGLFEQPVIDYQAAQNTAEKRCAAWGYKNAESFDTGVEQCQAYNGYGNCVRSRVTVTYQCIN